MEALGGPTTKEGDAFIQEYRKLIKKVYPKQKDGTTLFSMKRFFLVAQKWYCELHFGVRNKSVEGNTACNMFYTNLLQQPFIILPKGGLAAARWAHVVATPMARDCLKNLFVAHHPFWSAIRWMESNKEIPMSEIFAHHKVLPHEVPCTVRSLESALLMRAE